MAQDAQAQAELQALSDSIDAQIKAFVAARVAAGAEEYQAAEVFSEVLSTGAFGTPFLVVDGGADTTEGWTLNNPVEFGTQAVTYLRKVNTAGAVIREAFVTPEDGAKVDGSAGAQSGDKILVLDTGHQLISGPRKNGVYKVAIAGWCTPYAGQGPQLGKAGAFEGGGSPPPPPGGGMTKEECQAIVDAAVADIKAQVDADMHIVVNNLLVKMGIALDEKKVMTEAMFAGGSGSAVVYQQLVNTSYTGALGAIKDSGKPPVPPPPKP